MDVIQSEIRGERGTGFEKFANKGPFECGNCRYFRDGCTQKTMKAVSRQPRNAYGNVAVAAKDCCEYVERKGVEMAEEKKGEHEGKPKKKHLHEIRSEQTEDGHIIHHHTYKAKKDDDKTEPERKNMAVSANPDEAGEHVADQFAMNQPAPGAGAAPPDAGAAPGGGAPDAAEEPAAGM